MRDSKLVQLLQKLPPKQVRAFRRFLASPYFNRRPEPLRLFDLIDSRILPYKHRNLSEAACLELLFPDESADLNKLRKLKTATFHLLLQFLEIEELQQHPAHTQSLRRQALERVQATEILHSELSTQEKALQNRPATTADDYRTRADFYLDALRLRPQQRTARPEFTHWTQDRQNESLIRLSRLAYLSRNQHAILGQAPILELAQPVTNTVLALGATAPIQARIWALLYQNSDQARNTDQDTHSDQNPIPNHTSTLLHLLQDPQLVPQKTFCTEIYTALLNQCARQLNQGHKTMADTMLTIYRDMLQRDLLLIDGKISPWPYKNIVALAARAGEFDWLATFMERMTGHVAPDPHGNAQLFNQGVVAFFQQHFATAFQKFNQVLAVKEDIFYGLDARLYLLRIHYLEAELAPLEALLVAFKRHLDRHPKLSETHRSQYRNYLQYFQRLVQIPAFEKEKLKDLRKEILGQKVEGGTGWMVEQIEAMLY